MNLIKAATTATYVKASLRLNEFSIFTALGALDLHRGVVICDCLYWKDNVFDFVLDAMTTPNQNLKFFYDRMI